MIHFHHKALQFQLVLYFSSVNYHHEISFRDLTVMGLTKCQYISFIFGKIFSLANWVVDLGPENLFKSFVL